jgi:ribose-phosphate pyrophosphokinase
MCIVDHYGHIPTLYMPYLPHARMDRVKASTDVFTLKTFAKALNALGFDTVRMLDVHSNVGMALIDHAEAMPLTLASFHEWTIDEVTERCDGAEPLLFFPDEGAMKRYAGLFTDYPIAFGIKKRNWEDGKIVGLQVVNGDAVKGKDVLIVEDICTYGGTFYHSAKAFKELGAERIDLYVTHLEKSVYGGDAYQRGMINHFYTTPSLMLAEDLLPSDKHRITVLE